MRRGNFKRNLVIVISFIICVIIAVVVAVAMNRATRSTYNTDNININAECISVNVLSSDDTKKIIESGEYNGEKFSPEEMSKLKNSKNKICELNFKYDIYNATGNKISNLKMDLSDVKESNLKGLIICWPIKMISHDDESYCFNQKVLYSYRENDTLFETDDISIYEQLFKYKFCYNLKGRYGERSLEFVATKLRENEGQIKK